MREIALDTETTGLSYAKGDRITEIGCVEIIDKKITGKTLHIYVNPEREVSSDAIEISGLTYEFLRQFKPFKEIAKEFLEFVRKDRLVIHNAPFDMGFLNFELNKAGVGSLDSNNVIDTLLMAKEKFPGSPATLDALCKRFSVNASSRSEHHGALIDAELLAEVYLHMSIERVQRNLFGSFANKEDQDDLELQISNATTSITETNVRHFEISDSELELHNEFLKKLKNPIWDRFKE